MGIKKKAVDLLGDVIDTTTKAVKKKIKKNKPGKQDDLFPETIPTTPEATKAVNKLSATEKRKFRKSQSDMFADELKDATEARKLKAVKKRKDAMKTKRKDPEVENGITQKDLDRAMKTDKKAAGGPIKKFGAGGWVTKQLKKGAGKAAGAAKELAAKKAAAAAEAVKKKTKKELAKIKRNRNIKNKTITKPGPVTKSSDFDTGASKHRPLMKKQEDVVKKYKLAGGGFLKKAKGAWEKAKDAVEGKKVAKARHDKLEEKGKMTTSQRKKVLKRQKEKGYAHGGKVTKPSVPKESNVRTGFRGLQFPKKSIDGIAERGLTRAKHK